PLHVPAYPVDVVDTIGAGDAHCAGLLAGLSAGWPLPQAVDLANRVAACVVASLGAANPPDWPQLQQRFPQA
ncbi:carbohydrate kinase family protein, partial [Serratia marcescens]